jgi:hypothetical protein
MINFQTLTDRLLESENLTADLEDPEADWLLQWGIAQIPLVVEGYTDEEAAGEKVSTLMAFMRRAGRSVARKDRRTPAELAAALDELAHLYGQAFTPLPSLTPETLAQAAAQMQAASPREALRFLVEWLASCRSTGAN